MNTLKENELTEIDEEFKSFFYEIRFIKFKKENIRIFTKVFKFLLSTYEGFQNDDPAERAELLNKRVTAQVERYTNKKELREGKKSNFFNTNNIEEFHKIFKSKETTENKMEEFIKIFN